MYRYTPCMLPRSPPWRYHIRLPGLPTLLALASFALIVVRTLTTVDPYWDTLAYHWPFAARLSGLCDGDCYSLSRTLEQRYEGFPLLLHAVRGFFWRLTGSPATGNLLNVALLLALGGYLKHRFSVPLAWSWLAFIAIPEVQIQLSSSYVDVPTNAAVTLALMVLLRMLVQRDADHRLDVALALAALGFAAQSKFQMIPIALAVWLVITALAMREPSLLRARRSFVVAGVLGLGGAVVLLPKLVLNGVNFGNPFYPVEILLGPIHLPGVESMAPSTSVSDALVDWPAPVRWLASVFEFDAFRARYLPWTVGQGDVSQSSPSFRMGGYFVAYVLGALALIGWGARATSTAKWAAALIIVLSLICAWTPMSHELRYNLFWMLTLGACTMALGHSRVFASSQQAVYRRISHGLVLIAGLSVVLMTGGAYLRVDGPNLADLLQPTHAAVAEVPDGGILCVLNRHPYGFLYASVFHPSRHYQTKSLWADEQANCTLRLDIDRGSVVP